jgi:predicted CoA-binding protein
MSALKEAAEEFLGQKRIAVAGVSRNPGSGQAANVVYRRLRDRGYSVFAVNPNADTVEGDRCYHDLRSIDGGVDGVVVATTPAVAEQVVADCAELGIKRAWLHGSFGTGSRSERATAYGREHGVQVIDGGCPCMFGKTADFPHRCMRGILSLTGGLPKEV